jgi:hypothetical protein
MKKIIAIATLFAPVLVFAQTQVVITDANSLTTKLVAIGNVIIYLLISLAVIFIIWNVVMFLVRGNDPTKRTDALKSIGWGIVGLAVILSIWGLVNILTGTFRTTPPAKTIPQIQQNTVPIIP